MLVKICRRNNLRLLLNHNVLLLLELLQLTNILLTENKVPKLADFGLAKMLEMEETKVFTDVRGTIGYMDPEYITHSKLTCASDIYSFGVVALQLLSGRKVIELDIVARDSLTKKVNIYDLLFLRWYICQACGNDSTTSEATSVFFFFLCSCLLSKTRLC